ncbi:uncharacterized protein METZ01_LOCUS283769 [marine metagenome]|uniref:Uncharacterized protein n=1 Tax=marine metagenome TaxID=408172 RepID=A0A382L525_9ZZZZ
MPYWITVMYVMIMPLMIVLRTVPVYGVVVL